jgi:enolase
VTYYYRASKKRLARERQISYVAELSDRFDLFYMEDPLQEEDFDGYSKLRGLFNGTLVVGDDLYTTDPERLRRGVESECTNGVILKVNQIGTLGQASQFASLARRSGQAIAASHRSGDNEGGHLAHFAVGFSCALIKCGVVGGERTTKLNELIRIAERLGISKMTSLVL